MAAVSILAVGASSERHQPWLAAFLQRESISRDGNHTCDATVRAAFSSGAGARRTCEDARVQRALGRE